MFAYRAARTRLSSTAKVANVYRYDRRGNPLEKDAHSKNHMASEPQRARKICAATKLPRSLSITSITM